MSAIELTDVVKEFPTAGGPVRAVDHVSLRIEPGEVVAFLGPNGAGKTTCTDMMLGLTEPTSGRVSIFDGSPTKAVREGRISGILQSGGLLSDLTVAQTLKMVAAVHHGDVDLDAVMRRADLTSIARRKVSRCSGGEQQRLRFGLALMSEPDILMLDEPTAGMDVTARARFWSSIKEETARGRTVVFATHYLKEAQDVAERIILIAKGRIVADGTVEEIRHFGSGKSVSARWPQWTPSIELPGVTRWEQQGDRVRWWCDDSDALALHLLQHTPAVELEITESDLDEAFTHLTDDSVSDDERASA